jgi:hypothetical protein
MDRALFCGCNHRYPPHYFFIRKKEAVLKAEINLCQRGFFSGAGRS